MPESTIIPEIITRQAAKAEGLKRYFTGKPCKRGHMAERLTANTLCVPCKNENNRRSTLKNRDKVRAYHQQYRKQNKDALIAKNRANYEKHKDKRLAYGRKYHLENREQCLNRHKEWQKNNPDYSKERSKQYRKDNLEALREYDRARYERDKERRKACINEWLKQNPDKKAEYYRTRRAKEKGGGGKHTTLEIKALLKCQRNRCACCKASIKNGYHIDHIVALANSGSNDIRNIQLLCPPCNWAKGAKDPILFMQSRGYLL